VYEYSTKLISRELTNNEVGIILAVLHREYSKLNTKIPIDKQIPYKKKEEGKKESKTKKAKTNENVEKSITININFNSDSDNKTDWKDKLKNLFQNDFEFVMLAIRQNVADRKDTDDIIDIMNHIKIELGKQFDLDSNQTSTIMQFVQNILKEEELLD
jgi:hypothetical protein